MKIEKVKKILLITSISAVAIAALMLILQVFGVPIFVGVQLRILLIVATLGISSGIAINEIAVIKRKKVLGYVSLGLLAISVLFAIVVFCSNILITESAFNRITGITALVSILFIIIVSLYSKIGAHLIGLQIPAYASFAAVDLILVLTAAGINMFALPGMISIFIILCIISVALMIILSVIASKKNGAPEVAKEINSEFVTITKEEYEQLKAENQELKEKLAKVQNMKE